MAYLNLKHPNRPDVDHFSAQGPKVSGELLCLAEQSSRRDLAHCKHLEQHHCYQV